ncbi:MAG: right-handed parallel beta-helix repeat-containing protein [Sphingobacteriales bacterium]|nr:right-handed parallel beta-helix repeat-containing protein [Sphingobacteriales bacterium]
MIYSICSYLILSIAICLNTLIFISNGTHSKKGSRPYYKKYPTELRSNKARVSQIKKSTPKGILLINNLPLGYVKNGSVDYTYYIQQAIDKYETLIFPDFPLLVNDSGLNIPSNRTLIFEEGSEIRLKPSNKTFYNIFNIENVNNVVLQNPKIIGDRNYHLGEKGEAGIGVGIRGSNNITINNAEISNCWGDGIYIGQYKSKYSSKNVIIRNTVLDRNRRDGISIISVDNLLLENLTASNSNGAEPMAGINFEPNNPDCIMSNIRVLNPITRYNTKFGIQIGIRRMLGNGNRVADILIQNHLDRGSANSSFKVVCVSRFEPSVGTMSANIKVLNPIWENPKSGFPVYFSTNQPNFRVSIVGPKILSNGRSLSKPDINKLLNIKFNGGSALSLIH